MKFVVSRNELGNLIKKIQSVVPQNTPIPVLTHVLIETYNDELVFTATDLTVSTRCVTKAKVYEKGAISIPSKRFFQLVKELTEANLEISSSAGEMAQITSGSSCFRLLSMEKEDFPMLPDIQNALRFSLPAEQLKTMLQRTSFAVSREESRYVLTGVLLAIANGVATIVGTDGKRLAKIDAEVTLDKSFSGEYIIPIKAVEEIIKMCSDEGEAAIFLDQDKIAVECDNTLLITKLLSGEFPDFSPVISTESNVKLDLHREELITLLKQVALFTNESSHSVKFSFLPGELTLTANCTKVGEGKVSMAVNYSGELLEIAFNPFFFLDILKHSKDELVSLGISDSYNPGIITDSASGLFVIMPMRLHDD
ncbi:DNA polymerase III subunit beta [Chlamydia pneumoniae]|uniref:Beta sliding clamp n=1 Tax=Chlamydia pneumoniae TaxID=83558 RepID=A0A0F7XD24_CHLPN|nr:DNA polymerase III subunit beta [Chlamydia pneumoniae]AAD18487.1 DNA Polymerase III (beta chain) [Chlamydia pneumoniae CWL029]CRI32839.1 DNA polymerase III subunit beta [Chlamydia pneumoniae]CRI36829.1 DNA polymerase III subunit beta [Chlamydia pneumoniae]CRI37952.1 DNA polymerase III subunit beta [Chlamydia pneumoniae]CRI39087.1 DNA polymerase III subunit beta [Chlamydia pneumoniae]